MLPRAGAAPNVDEIERRKFPRVQAKFAVEYTVGDKTIRGRASTLGGGGLFLLSPAFLPEGAEVGLRFRPARHLPFIQARGKVCYTLPDRGTAVEFTQLSDQDHEMILRLIHHKMANRRKFPRVPLATQIYCDECMSIAFSKDLSRGGMFIETRDPLPAGSQINLRFHLNDGGPIVLAFAEVRYSITKLGMGVQFLEIAAADRKRIDDYVAKFPELAEPNPED
jgi:c-di-GMP-binding flagellar brake protein YcgR